MTYSAIDAFAEMCETLDTGPVDGETESDANHRVFATFIKREAAASAMLAALKSARIYLGDEGTDDSPEARAARTELDTAIAQAEAARFKSSN